MGKAKKRNFHNCVNSGGAMNSFPSVFTREEAVSRVIEAITANDFGPETKDIITLFGITAEELAEAGAAYEDLVALKSVLK
ncbi:MAG: hypothetical protein KHX03_07555 [Clostridium sp.]|nr:hypothetical protein [Clostridium sp.]